MFRYFVQKADHKESNAGNIRQGPRQGLAGGCCGLCGVASN